MGVEWDERKRKSNKVKHGLDFSLAELVLDNDVTEVGEEEIADEGEQRFIGIGPLGGIIVVVVFLYRNDNRRIISMRRATRHEKETYKSGISRARCRQGRGY